MRVGIAVFPGSNCDRDMHHVLRDVMGADVSYCWHDAALPGNLDAVVLPGGFSYGDRLRAGVIAAHSPIISGIREMARRGAPVLGVCNGFQILAEAGMLPGVLLPNDSMRFVCRWTNLIVKSNSTPFTRALERGATIPIPVANGEGRYYADESTLEELEKNDQIVFLYEEDINGSSRRIAGICSEKRNIVGMMPHPERAAEPEINPYDCAPARAIFESMMQVAVQ